MSESPEQRVKRGGFRVPIALAPDGRLLAAYAADRRVTYTCPSCDARVALRAGAQRRPHFAHVADPVGACSAESVKHILAKLTIREVVLDWLAGAVPRPIFLRRCAALNTLVGCTNTVEHGMPRIDSVELEFTHDGLRPDVVFIRNGKPAAAVEILATHRVDELKRDRMRLPWVELRADDVLSIRDRWLPVQDHFRAIHCGTCAEAARDYRSRYADGYLRANTRCFRCRGEIVVYSWNGNPPPAPRPSTVKYEYSKTLEDSYWANTCSYCGALKGDSYLYSWPDGPFGGIDEVVPPDEIMSSHARGWDEWDRKEYFSERPDASATVAGDDDDKVG